MYSSQEDKQAHEVRKLRRELMDAQDKVQTLTSQLTTNVSLQFYLNLAFLPIAWLERVLIENTHVTKKSVVLRHLKPFPSFNSLEDSYFLHARVEQVPVLSWIKKINLLLLYWE